MQELIMDFSRLEETTLQRRSVSSSSNAKNAECIFPHVGKQIYLEVFTAGADHRGVKLSTEQEAHLIECNYCSSCFPIWKLKEAGLIPTAERIVSQARSGQTEILRKSVGDFEVYFEQSNKDPDMGILVKTNGKGDLLLAEEADIQRFSEMI